jgi:glycosyltransferase involved in cell wall biosynthesis
MKYNPIVSVIIPTYNRGYIIEETLDSVLNQSYSNWECIVVDDGGNDNTDELIKRYISKNSRFKYVKRPINVVKGVSSCRNYGVDLSKGEFILFLDSDDILASNALNNRVKYFRQYPDNDFLVFSTQFFENNITIKKDIFNIDPICENRESYLSLFLKHQFPWTIMSPIWTKEYLVKNKFRNDLYLLEDIVFHIEILFNNDVKFKRIKEIDNFYRIPNWGKNNTTESIDKLYDSISYLLKNYDSKITNDKKLKDDFSRFVKIIYKIILQSKNANQQKIKMLNFLKKYDYITIKERLLFKVFSVIYRYKLNNIKNIGMFTLINYLNKVLIQ